MVLSCSSKCLQPKFCWSSPAFMAKARPFDDAEHANVRNSPLQDLSSNFGSPDGSVPDLERVGVRSTSSMEERFEAILARNFRSSKYISVRWHRFPRPHGDSPDSKQYLVAHTISGNCQAVGSLAARVSALEAGAASASSVSGSAGSWPLPGQVDGSTAAGSHDPGSSKEDRNTRRRLDKFSSPDDENARSAVLLRFPYPHGPERHLLQPMCQTESTAKQEPHQLDSYFTQEPGAKNFWQDAGMMASLIQLTVPSVTPVAQFWFVNPSHLQPENSEDVLHRSGRFWLMTPKAISSFWLLISEHRSSTFSTKESELVNQFFRLAPFCHEQRFNVTASGLCEPHVTDDVLRQLESEASNPAQNRGQCVMAALCFLAFSPLGESRPFFLCGVLFWWHLHAAICLCRRQPPT